MIITCPECATEFKTPDAVFVHGPRKLRCAKCSHVWAHDPESAVPPSDEITEEKPDQNEWAGALPENSADEDDLFDFGMPDNTDANAKDDVFDDMADQGGLADDDDEFEKALDTPDMGESGESETAVSDFESGEGGGDKPEPPHDIESLAAADGDDEDTDQKHARQRSLKLIGASAAALLTFIIAGYGSYAYRENIAGWFPAIAPVYAMMGVPVNLIGLEFSDVGVGRSFDNGFPVLSVKGRLTNVSGHMRQIPDIRLALRAPDKQELYFWTIKVKRAPLKPNETVQFSTRLASPPREAENIEIRFHRKTGLRVGAL